MADSEVTTGNNKVKFLVGVLVVLAAATAVLWFMPHPADRGGGQPLDGGGPQVGRQVPDFDLVTITGQKTRFSDLQKKVVLVNFWATWCPPCMLEMKSVRDLREAYKDRGFEVAGIDLDDDPASAIPETKDRFDIKFPLFMDPENRLGDLFQVDALPTTVILDAKRKILFVEHGERDWTSQTVRRQIEQWLDGGTNGHG
jgi:peroxiredoxin